MSTPRISTSFRVALVAKGLLLLGIGAVMVCSAAWIAFAADRFLPIRIGVPLVLAYFGTFVSWAARLAFADAWSGEAQLESGALPLASRKSGYSMRLPNGRFLEFVLFNPWEPLEQGARYTVVFGRRSGVLVEPPKREAPAAQT